MVKKFGNAPPSEALSYKLSGPVEVPGAVQRTQILDTFCKNSHIQVVCIQAPAGHGKTTTLQQFVEIERGRGAVTGWLTLDASDNDMGRFLSLFYGLIDQVTGGKSADRKADVNREDTYSHDEQVISFMSQASHSISIFLDDLQVIRNPNLLRLLSRILEKLPIKTRVFLGSREIPDIGLSRLLAHNRALLFKADAVRFSLEETEEFFEKASAIQLNNLEVEVVHRQTEGWPAAIQLLKLALEGDADKKTVLTWNPSRLPDFAEYLANNVLRFQQDEVKAFLKITCRLARVSADVCDAVMARSDSLQMLLDLEKQGLFLHRLGVGGNWFKYHALFASYVEQLEDISREEFCDLHFKAFSWFKEHGYMEEAMHHAIAIEEYDFACEILNEWASSLISNAHLSTVERWFERIPLDKFEGRLPLQIKIAWSLVFLRNTDGITKIMGLIQKDYKRWGSIKGANVELLYSLVHLTEDNFTESSKILENMQLPDILSVDGFEAFECGAMSNIKGIFAQAASSFQAANAFLVSGRAYSDRGHASFSWAYSLAILGMTYLAQGQLNQALSRLRQGISQPEVFADESFSSVSVIVGYAQALYEINDIESARKYLEESIALVGKAALPDWLAVGYITLSKIYLSEGEETRAHLMLDELQNIALCGGLERVAKSALWEKCRQYLVNNRITEAEETRRRISDFGKDQIPRGWVYFSDDDAGDSIGQIRMDIYTSAFNRAKKLLDSSIRTAFKLGRKRSLIKLHMLEAMLYYEQQKKMAAHRAMLNAIRLAQPGGFLRTFCDEGGKVLRIVAEFQCDNPGQSRDSKELQEFIDKILRAGKFDRQQTSSRLAFENILQSLTGREIEMLRLVAQGIPNKTIADQMYISSNTVKFHLRNLYSKLGVKNRTEASALLQEMSTIGLTDLLG